MTIRQAVNALKLSRRVGDMKMGDLQLLIDIFGNETSVKDAIYTLMNHKNEIGARGLKFFMKATGIKRIIVDCDSETDTYKIRVYEDVFNIGKELEE